MSITATNRTNSGLNPYNGIWEKEQILHLLRRVHFGVKHSDLEHFLQKSLNDTIDEILDIDYTPPSPPINNYQQIFADPIVPAGETWINNFNPILNNLRNPSFKSWWIGLMVNQDRTIREKMVLFWHNHFATQTNVYQWANFAYSHNQLLRDNCLKNFKNLVKEVTIDPAMLLFLNGVKNTRRAPDENYARELQELFTVGKDITGYTESDVIAAAKVLTGWRINATTRKTIFDHTVHETSNKTFSAFYGNKVIQGKSGAAGAEETDELISMILDTQEVANFICRKIYRWFVYYEIDAAAEQNVIQPMATIFRNNNYEIKPVLEALFKSEHFYDEANMHAQIKSPVDFFLAACRQNDLAFPNPNDYQANYQAWLNIGFALADQQQEIGDPPDVAGWPAYYQVPVFYKKWISADTLSSRNKIMDVLLTTGLNVRGFPLKFDVLKMADAFTGVAYIDDFIGEVTEFYHTIDLSISQIEQLKSILLSGQSEDYYWTNAWNDYKNDPRNNAKQTVVLLRLTQFFKYIFNLSEYQLM